MVSQLVKELLEAGVHFGHQTKRWNPKMKKYIFGERNSIYIIDLEKTAAKLQEAASFLKEVASRGGTILFVGTKKQAQEVVVQEAKRCGMAYIAHRWLGGTMTNFETVKRRIDRLRYLLALRQDPTEAEKYSKKEWGHLQKEAARLQQNLEGLLGLDKRPDCVVVVDSKKEEIAVEEANRLKIPVVGLVDTNCDPDKIEYVVPGNDDAIKSIRLVLSALADAVLEGRAVYKTSQPVVEGQREEPAAEIPAAPVEQEPVEVSESPVVDLGPITKEEVLVDEKVAERVTEEGGKKVPLKPKVRRTPIVRKPHLKGPTEV